jgi:hypothetical protein
MLLLVLLILVLVLSMLVLAMLVLLTLPTAVWQECPARCGWADIFEGPRTLFINFLHTPRISLAMVAENIMTCLSWGVSLKIACTSPRMSEVQGKAGQQQQETLAMKSRQYKQRSDRRSVRQAMAVATWGHNNIRPGLSVGPDVLV